MIHIDQINRKLNNMTNEQLGRLYCDLNGWRWNEEILGKEPESWKFKPLRMRHRLIKFLMFSMIEPRLSEEDKSYYWWKFELNKAEEEWEEYYFNSDEYQRYLEGG